MKLTLEEKEYLILLLKHELQGLETLIQSLTGWKNPSIYTREHLAKARKELRLVRVLINKLSVVE
jgi:hypothetical protein